MGSKDKDEKKKKKKKLKSFDAEASAGLSGGDDIDRAGDIVRDEPDIPGTPTPEAPGEPTHEAPQAPAHEAPVYLTPETPRRKRRRWPIVLIVVVVLALLLVLPRLLGLRRAASDNSGYETYTLTRGDMTVTLSGSGTLSPADEYTIRPLISGDILSAPFEEGDIVSKNEVLYTVDSADVRGSIEQAENNLADAERSYKRALETRDDLNMKAGGGGLVTEMNVEIGDTVTAGQPLATVINSETMTFTALFQKDFAEGIHVGDSADVTLSDTFETYSGTVTDVSPVDTVLTGSVIAREITVEVENPGAFTPSQTPYATINGVSNISSSAFAYKYEGTVSATMAGIVDDVRAVEGTRVTKGQTVVVLHSDTIQQQFETAQSAVRDAELALENATAKLEDYTIRSPISGTIVEKNIKEGDTLETGTSACTIFDLSCLTLTLNVDELDIKKVAAGQSVTITAEASEGIVYTGVVTQINISGTTVNGVTSYPVTIRIDETEGLLPGMNVDATVTVASLTDVLTVPVGALLRGNFVLLKSDAYDPATAEAGIPEGYVYTEVTPGASNDESIVITEGLEAGDIIAVPDTTPTSYDSMPFGMGGQQQGPDRAEAQPENISEGAGG
jgi:HlyD family secretion protein